MCSGMRKHERSEWCAFPLACTHTVVAGDADVAADDAGSGGTVIDMDETLREALCTLLAPFASGASSAGAVPGSTRACRGAWGAAGQLPPREAAMAIQARLLKLTLSLKSITVQN